MSLDFKTICEELYNQMRINLSHSDCRSVDIWATPTHADNFHGMVVDYLKANYGLEIELVKTPCVQRTFFGMKVRTYNGLANFGIQVHVVIVSGNGKPLPPTFMIPDYRQGQAKELLTGRTINLPGAVFHAPWFRPVPSELPFGASE